LQEAPCIANNKLDHANKHDHTELYLKLYQTIAFEDFPKILSQSNKLISLLNNKAKDVKKESDTGIIMSINYLKHLWLWAAILSKTDIAPPFDIKSMYSSDENENWISHLLELKFKDIRIRGE